MSPDSKACSRLNISWLQEASSVPQLKDRALVAQKNADIRKRKQALLAEVPQLKTIVKKGKVTQEMVVARQERVCICLADSVVYLLRIKET